MRTLALLPLQVGSLGLCYTESLLQSQNHKGIVVQNAFWHNLKRKYAEIARTALKTLRLQFPLFDLQSLTTTLQHIRWRERIKASFGYDPLQCPCCGRTLELAEIWEPKRGHIWMRRWLETHRLRKAARQAMQQLREARSLHYRQLAFNFDP